MGFFARRGGEESQQQAAGGRQIANGRSAEPLLQESQQAAKWVEHHEPAFCLPPAARRLLFSARRLQSWLKAGDGDMVWSALVVVTVLLPLASLTIDVPRYFVLRSRLQLAVDAAAEATAQCVDLPHFQQTGETRLDVRCSWTEPGAIFSAVAEPLHRKGYRPRLTGVHVNEQDDRVTVQADGTTRLFFGMTPEIRVGVEAESRFRMEMH